jgi:type II secretory pathway pseudopilin PulG
MFKIRRLGFTLAELLVSLLILAEIFTFTIPKIITSQQNGRSKAIAKEVAGMFASAWQQASAAGDVRVGMGVANLTQYMNYVKTDTSTPIDDWPTYGSWGCSATVPCLVLHNGARVSYDLNELSCPNRYQFHSHRS